MAKRTLEEKIKLVWIWALILSVVYFAIGAYLKSDGLKFDPSKTYDILKDTLTLTATFLAPVAAFVLFSDWRKQHRAISNENVVNTTLTEIKGLQNKVNNAALNLAMQQNQEIESNMLPHLQSIEEIQAIILSRKATLESMKDNFKNLNFITIADEILNNQYFLLFYAKTFIDLNRQCNLTKDKETLGARFRSYELFNNQRINFPIQSDVLLRKLNESAKEYRIR